MENEIWKVVDWYKSMYAVSTLWRVKNIKSDRIMKTYISKWWYELITLSKLDKYFHASVHRLVAEAFIENTYNKPQVNHKDWNKKNNILENLEWVTVSENWKHAVHVLFLWKETWLSKNKPTKWMFWELAKDHKVIEQYTKDWKYIATHHWVNQAARDLWIHASGITNCCKWKIKTTGWFTFRFKIRA